MSTVDAYLARLGLPRRAPDLDYLFALHRAQVERVPYENLEIMLGRPTGLGADESIGRIVTGRGGYCYHLNGAFGAVLTGLGFQVTYHVAGVHQRGADPVGPSGNHLALVVSGLPSAAAPDGAWLVDGGLGDAIHEPLPLVAGEHRQGPFAYRLEPSATIPGGWYFAHDEAGSFGGFDFGPQVTGPTHFVAKHAELSGPDGHFARLLVCQRRDADGVDILRDTTVTRWDAKGKTVTEYSDPAPWAATWFDVFGVRLTPDEVATLWPLAVDRHAAWVAQNAQATS